MAPNKLTEDTDKEKCRRYGLFLNKMSHAEANVLFWGCFIFNIVLLIIVSSLYARSVKRQKKFEIADHVANWHPDIPSPHHSYLQRKHLRTARKLLFLSFAFSLIMIPVIVVEALAGLNINFCNQEDLIMFYWGPFWLLSVGTLIATWGLFLSQRIENEPAWNVALGTPVLVFAALGHWVHVGIAWCWRYWRGRREERMLSDRESLAPKNLAPRYLSHCMHCQTDTYFPSRNLWLYSYPSQASSQRIMLDSSNQSRPDSVAIANGSGDVSSTAAPGMPVMHTNSAPDPALAPVPGPRVTFEEPRLREKV